MPSQSANHAHANMPKLKGLSLRQPWAELVIRGVQQVEQRTRPVRIRGRVYIYASLGRLDPLDEADAAAEYGLDVDSLPRGVVIGTVEIADCVDVGYGEYEWKLENPQRLPQPVPPIEKPQPVWFHPFGK